MTYILYLCSKTDIYSDFLLYKEIDNKNINLFFKYIPEK